MDRMDFKQFKKALTQSGVPLEFEVAKLIASFDETVSVETDFSFTRTTERGMEKDFSVDLAATFLLGERQGTRFLWHTLFECKYRHEGVAWCFLPAVSQPTKNSYHPCYVILDRFPQKPFFVDKSCSAYWEHDAGLGITRTELGESLQHITECTKGLEIRNGQPNPEAVREGTFQLQYAHVVQVAADLGNELQRILEPILIEHGPSTVHIYTRFLVTTARLFVLRADLSLSEMESTTEYAELGQEKELIELRGPNSPDLNSYHWAVLEALKQIPEDWRQEIASTYPHLSENYKSESEQQIEILAGRIPSTFAVRLLALQNQLRDQITALKAIAEARLQSL